MTYNLPYNDHSLVHGVVCTLKRSIEGYKLPYLRVEKNSHLTLRGRSTKNNHIRFIYQE
jgi:hypothetical protein